MILVFASSKGGVGKSTICASLAAALALRGDRVIVMDLDQNRTIHRWAAKISIPDLTIEALPAQDISARLRAITASQQYDHILIDLAGAREVNLFKAIARADLVIIPAQASEPDIREAIVISQDVRDVEETAARKIPYRMLLTKMHPLRSRVTDFVFSELNRKGMPIFRTVTIERTSYREMFLNGVPPTKAEPDKGAGLEINNLLTEIEALLTATAATPSRAA